MHNSIMPDFKAALEDNHGGACLSEEEIARYVHKTASPKERFLIEEHITDCDLCFEAIEGAEKIMADKDYPLRLDRLTKRFTEKYYQQQTAAPVRKKWPKHYYLSAAAAMLVAGFLSIWYMQTRNPYAPLIAEYVTPYANTVALTRSAGPASDLENAMMNYELGSYQKASEQLKKIIENEPNHVKAHFYNGMSLFLTDDTRAAIEEFKWVAKANAGLTTESQWYLAWSYLKINNPDQAKALFEQMR